MSFRLRGEIDGAERSFLLLPGTNRVGSLDIGNEVVLPAHGVSRCHAEIVVDAVAPVLSWAADWRVGSTW